VDKNNVESTPDNFESYEAAAEFWDTHDTTDYLDEFRTVDVNTEFRARHFEIEIDENVVKVLQLQARERGVKIGDLASSLLRQQLGMAA
jgi:predicted phosphatase